jgi:hypothetical protein
VARDLIGHDSAAVSRHYTEVDLEVKRAAVATMPSVADLLAAAKETKPKPGTAKMCAAPSTKKA